MEDRKKRLLTLLFILVNVVIWGIFVIPRLGNFSEVIMTKIASGESESVIALNDNSEEILERIDFNTLRDPFHSPDYLPEDDEDEVKVETVYVYIEKEPEIETVPEKEPVVEEDIEEEELEVVEKTFTSRFNLESIMEFDGSYIATLSETEHYGSSDSSSSVPYSYRFGSGSSSSSSSSANHMVIVGDTVMEETVVEIAKNYVIMEKDGLYYKLTFSGGYNVDYTEK